MNDKLKALCAGLPLSPLPDNSPSPNIAHAAKKNINLTQSEREVEAFFRIFFA